MDFLTYEHTDGLNYINLEAEKFRTFYQSRNSKCIISGFFGAGGGVLFPRSDVKLLDYQENDEFHVAGFGLSGKAGIQATLFKHFVIKIENKYGYINMPDINLHKKGIFGRGKQAFWFTELDAMVGATFTFNQKMNKAKAAVNYKE